MPNTEGKPIELSDTKSWCSLNWQNNAQDISNCKIRSVSSSKTLSSYDPDRRTITLEWERPFKTGGKYDLEFGEQYELLTYYGMFNSDGEEDKKRLEGNSSQSVVIRLNQNNSAKIIIVTIQALMASIVYFF